MLACLFHSWLRKCVRRWSGAQAKMEKCSFLVLAFEMFIVSLLSHYIPLCLHCEWLVLIMQMRRWREAWVIITAEDGLWKSSPSHCHRDTTSWAERIASSNALSSPMAEQMHQVLPGIHRVCPNGFLIWTAFAMIIWSLFFHVSFTLLEFVYVKLFTFWFSSFVFLSVISSVSFISLYPFINHVMHYFYYWPGILLKMND